MNTEHDVNLSTESQVQLRHLSQSILLEESNHPGIVRLTLIIISSAILLIILWSAFAEVEEISKTTGQIVPEGHIQQIQHYDGGIVETIFTKEGEIVKKDQVLIKLNGAGTNEDLDRIKVEQANLQKRSERLTAFIDQVKTEDKLTLSKDLMNDEYFESMLKAKNAEQDVISKQIAQKYEELDIFEEKSKTFESNLKLARDSFNMQRELYNQGHISKIRFIEQQKELNNLEGQYLENKNSIQLTQQAIEELNNKQKALKAQLIDTSYDQLDKIKDQISQNNENIEKLTNKLKRLNIISPVKGIVKSLKVNTLGGVIQPGEVLMEVVPLDDVLIAEVKISTKDVGHLRVGQKALAKISSYDFSRYGSIKGKLIFISASTFEDTNNEYYYKGRIVLEKNFVGKDPTKNMIVPGMQLEADIITGEKTVLQYLLKPIQYSIDNAFKER